MNSASSILSFYFDMLFVNSIQSVKESFIGNSTLQKNGYSYIQEYQYYMKDEMVEDNGVMPIFATDIIRKEQFLERLLAFENISIYRNIEGEISNIIAKDRVGFVTSIYDEIEVLLRRLLRFDEKDTLLIEQKLLEIVSYLKDRYLGLLEYHSVFKYFKRETDVTFFCDRDLKYSFYIDLYEMAYTLFLIDDLEAELTDFIAAFTSPTPQLLTNKIKFSKNNYVVAYFLEALKPFFLEFTHIKIEQSKVFLNKQGKPLKSADIYTSLSRGKGKMDEEKNKIDKYILQLKSKYLK